MSQDLNDILLLPIAILGPRRSQRIEHVAEVAIEGGLARRFVLRDSTPIRGGRADVSRITRGQLMLFRRHLIAEQLVNCALVAEEGKVGGGTIVLILKGDVGTRVDEQPAALDRAACGRPVEGSPISVLVEPVRVCMSPERLVEDLSKLSWLVECAV